MGQWTYNAATGYTLATSGERVVFVPTGDDGMPRPLAAGSAVKAEIASPAQEVAIVIRGSGDLNTALVVRVDATHVRIYKRTLGTEGAELASAAHSGTTGRPMLVEVRPYVDGGKVQVFIDGAAAALLTYDATGDLPGLVAFGIDGDVNGARVLSLKVVDLAPVYAARADILWSVCGGELWASLDGRNLTLIKRQVAVSVGPVDGEEFEQRVYLVDGSTGKVFDPAALVTGDDPVEPWVPTAGTLPGQTATPGTTSATIVEGYAGRLLLNLEQNVFGSAVNNALDFDTAADTPGRAFSLQGAVASKIGQPVVAMLRVSGRALVVGCTRSIWRVSGDFALGAVEVSAVSETVGVTGKDALWRLGEDACLAHTTEGLMLIPPVGGPQALSTGRLRRFLDVRGEEAVVSVVRDVKRQNVRVLVNPRDGAAGTCVWYDERTSQYQGPGFFPIRYPARMGPTCAFEFEGRVLWGGEDGYIYTDDDAAADDDGEAIESFMAMELLASQSLDAAVQLTDLDLMLAAWSGPVKVSVYGGQTPEHAYEGDEEGGGRVLMRRYTADPLRRLRTANVTAPALVVEVAGTAGTRWGLEGMQAGILPAPLLRGRFGAATRPPAPCGQPVASAGDGPGAGSGPGSGGGDEPGDPGEFDPVACPTLAAGFFDTTDPVTSAPARRWVLDTTPTITSFGDSIVALGIPGLGGYASIKVRIPGGVTRVATLQQVIDGPPEVALALAKQLYFSCGVQEEAVDYEGGTA